MLLHILNKWPEIELSILFINFLLFRKIVYKIKVIYFLPSEHGVIFTGFKNIDLCRIGQYF